MHGKAGAAALRVRDDTPSTPPSKPEPGERIVQVLAAATEPMTRRALRDACRMRAATVGDVLRSLLEQGRVIETDNGIRLA